MWQVSGRSDITDFEEVVRLDTEYISIFILYCSKAEPESVLKTYCISAGIAIAIVIFAWLIGILPSQTSAGREYLGFYFATFGPNLFLHTVLAYIARARCL